MISVVIPTIDGREESLARAIAAYRDTLDEMDYELLVISNKANWPTACNEGFRQAKGDIIHFTSDDLEALPGWHSDVVEVLGNENVLPAAAVYDYLPPPEGVFSNVKDGADGAFVHFTRVPIMTRAQYDLIGPWPEIDYYADIWLSEKGRTLGIRTKIVYSYAFVHHWHQTGRLDSQDRMDASGWALNRLREEMV